MEQKQIVDEILRQASHRRGMAVSQEERRMRDVEDLISRFRAVGVGDGRLAPPAPPAPPVMKFGSIPVDPSLFQALAGNAVSRNPSIGVSLLPHVDNEGLASRLQQHYSDVFSAGPIPLARPLAADFASPRLRQQSLVDDNLLSGPSRLNYGSPVYFPPDELVHGSRGAQSRPMSPMSLERGVRKGVRMKEKKNKSKIDDCRVHSNGLNKSRPGTSPISPLDDGRISPQFTGPKGFIYHFAKDQNGCRFLQQKLDEGNFHVDVIFHAIIDYVDDLMVNPFSNYLIQKLLDLCNEEQRLRIILMITEDPTVIISICLNIHGTRSVQKLIETLKTRQQIALVVSALKPGFFHLIKDLNGNHVIQRCLQTLSTEDNKFIFEAAAKHCVDIATHQHGCCVLQRCIAHSTGAHQANLVTEISANGLLLAQDAYGNYVVQYILELKFPLGTRILVSRFEGNYAQLSMQKFSSNVIEKCLKVFDDKERARIIIELLSVPQFEQLLQDPYANYVIQSAIEHSEGSLLAALIEAIRPHAAVLRSNPYCKRIFSRALLKK